MMYIKRETTNIIKGIAVILMCIHHFFTFPEWYVGGVSYPELVHFAEIFREPLKICVVIFAFLTGYFYSRKENADIKYSIKKVIEVYTRYWIVCFVLIIVSVLTGGYVSDARKIMFEFVGVTNEIVVFGWYISFFLFSMLLLPIIRPFLNKSIGWAIVIGIFTPSIVFGLLLKTNLNGFALIQIERMRYWFPCITSGYIFGKYGLFEQLNDICEKYLKHSISNLLLCVGIAFTVLMERGYFASFFYGSTIVHGENVAFELNMDIVYGPLFIFALTNIIQAIPYNPLAKGLAFLGKYSLFTWMYTCVFFGPSREIFQHILYFPHNVLVVLAWGIGICLCGAVLSEWLIKKCSTIIRYFVVGRRNRK